MLTSWWRSRILMAPAGEGGGGGGGGKGEDKKPDPKPEDEEKDKKPDPKPDDKKEGDESSVDESKWDENTKNYIKQLRNESASHRTKNKELVSAKKSSDEKLKAVLKAAGIEDDSEKPEEKVKTLTANNETIVFRNAILESAVHNGIPSDNLEFYEFLMTKAVSELAEGDELSEEAITAIVAKVKKAGKGSANSSVGTGGDGKEDPPKPGESGVVSLDEFCRMSITQKSELYTKKPDVYTKLLAEAKAKKRLV